MPDIASLGIAIDSTQVDAGTAKLETFTQAGAKAEAQTEKLGAVSGATATEMAGLQAKIAAAAQAQLGMTQAQAAAAAGLQTNAQAANDAAKAYATARTEAEQLNATANKLKAAYDPATAAQLKFKQVTTEANAALQAGALTLGEYKSVMAAAGKEAESYVSSAVHAAGATSTVTRETLVLGREALRGNWTRMAGSATILAQAMGLLSYALSPVAIAIEAVTAALVGGFVIAGNYSAALKTQNDLAAGLGVTVGLTGDKIREAAEAGATAANVSIGTAQKQAEVYAQTGKISGGVMTGLISITEKYAQATGEKAKDANKELAAAFADPAKGAEELDGKLNFLTASQLENIKALAESGDKLGAQDALYKALKTDVDNVQTKTDGWTNSVRALGNAAHDAEGFIAKLFSHNQNDVDLLYSGFPGSQVLPGVQAKNAAAAKAATDTSAAQDRLAVKSGFAVAQQYDLGGVKTQVELEDQLAKVETALAAARKTGSDQTGALAQADDALTRAVTTYVGPAQKAHDIAVATLASTNAITPAQKGAAAAALVRAKAEGEVATAAAINQRATDAAREATDKKADSSRNHAATLAAEQKAIEVNSDYTLRAASAYLNSTAAGEQAVEVAKAMTEATKKKLTPDQQAAKVAAELNLQSAQAAENGGKQVASLRDQNAAQVAMNTAVESGAMTYAQASEELKLNNALLPLQTALVNADAKTKQILTTVIAALTQAYHNLNASQDTSKILQQTSALEDQADILREQIKLADASNIVRAQTIAQLKAEQDLRNNPAGPQKGSPEGDKYIATAVQNAGLGVQASASQNSTEKYKQDYANFLGDLQTMTQNAASDMASSFGNVGKSFGGMVSAMATHAKMQADIELKLGQQTKAAEGDKINGPKRIALAVTQAANDSRAAELKYYSDSAGAFASMFGQKTAAYQVLTTVETVFHALEMANALESMAADGVFTASSIANALERGVADAAAGAAKIFSQLGMFAFPVVGAMVAALAAVGLGMANHGGSSSLGANDAKNNQAAQGAGTVSGDATAKSNSISNSLANAQKYQNTDLEYQSQMVDSLKSIENNIGSLTTLLARSLNLSGGALDTSGLGLGFSGSKPTLGNLFTSSSTTKTLEDQGLQFNTQSLASAIAQGLNASAYAEVQTEKKSSFLGISTGDRYSLNTTNTALDRQTSAAISAVLASLKGGVLTAASTLGIQGAEQVIDAFQLNIGKISLKGMTGDQIQTALNNVFSEVADEMSTTLLPMVAKFQKAGEGAFETLARLATDYTAVDTSLQSIGMTFNMVGLNSIAARESLITLVGGIDNLVAQTKEFTSDFLTPAEAIAPVATAVKKEMDSLGYSGVKTKEQFVALVQSIDLTTTSGQALYAALMSVAPAFAKVADYNTQAIQDAANAQINIINGIVDAVNNLQQQYQSFVTSIASYRQSLVASMGSPAVQTAIAYEKFQQTAAGAANGDLTYLGNLQSDSQSYLTALANSAHTKAEYDQGQIKVIGALDAAQKAAQTQVDQAQQLLNTANAQLQALGVIAGNTSSTSGGIATLAQATTALANAIANPVKPNTADSNYTPSTPTVDVNSGTNTAGGTTQTPSYTSTNGDYAAYVEKNSDLIADYTSHVGNKAWDDAITKVAGGTSIAQYGLYHWTTYGQFENRPVRPYAAGGVFTNGVVQTPTLFDIGKMGEAGPEAIMPLVNGPNGLGVRGSGASSKEVEAQIQALRTEMQAAMIALAKNTGDVAKFVKQWNYNGAPVRAVDPTQPIQVHTV